MPQFRQTPCQRAEISGSCTLGCIPCDIGSNCFAQFKQTTQIGFHEMQNQ